MARRWTPPNKAAPQPQRKFIRRYEKGETKLAVPVSKSGVPVVSWEQQQSLMRWKQGEHVTIVGATGSGKSYLALALMELNRDFNIAFGVKPRDDTLTAVMKRYSWERIQRLESAEIDPDDKNRRHKLILWPELKEMDDADIHPKVFGDALRKCYAIGRWAIFIDEAAYFTQDLKLEKELKRSWQQGRSIKMSIVGGIQRPAWVVRDMFSEAMHLCIFTLSDEQDGARLSDLGGPADKKVMRRAINDLDWDKRQFLYVNARTGAMCISSAPKDFLNV